MSVTTNPQLTGNGLSSAQLAALAASGATNGAGGAVRGNVIAILGDSRVEQCTQNTSTLKYLPNLGFISHAMSRSRNDLTFPLSLNFGVGGDTTTLVLARLQSVLAAMLAANVRYCAVLLGTNDICASGRTVAATTTDLANIYGQIRAAGITVCAMVETPRSNDGGGGVLSQTFRKRLAAVSSFIRDYAADNDGVILVDYTANMVDYAATGSGIGDPIGASSAAVTAYTYDGLHPQLRGAFWMGWALADAIANTQQSTRATFFTNPADVYHATDNPSGNLLSNGAFVGITGAATGGATGVVADSWTLQKTAGAGTVVGSKTTEAVANGTTYNTQTIVLVGAASCKLYEQLYTPASFTVGDVVYGECEVKITSATNLIDVMMQVDAGTEIGRWGHGGTAYWPDGSYTLSLRTPNINVTSNAAVTCYLQLQTAAAGGVTAEVLNAVWRHAD